MRGKQNGSKRVVYQMPDDAKNSVGAVLSHLRETGDVGRRCDGANKYGANVILSSDEGFKVSLGFIFVQFSGISPFG